MRIYISLILLLSGFIVNAQDKNENPADSLELESISSFMLYAAPFYNLSQFVETNSSFAGIGIGLVIKDRIEVFVSYSQIMDNFKKQIIFPAKHEYNQTNFNLSGQYSFLKKRIQPHVGAGVTYAKLAWEPEQDSNDTFSDHIFIYNVFTGASWTVNQILSLQANFGYNFAGTVEIVGLAPDDFTGFKMDLLVKIKLLNIQ